MIGIYEGAKQADICIIGGETASLPDIITGIDNKGFDLAGTAVGVVDKEKIITGEHIKPGNTILGFASNGIHSNGLTLARKILPKNMWMNMLTPTKIYVKEFKALKDEYNLLGLANITGGGVLNLARLTKYGFHLDNMPEPQMIFKKIQELGKISIEEMYKTFNMGIGFTAIVDDKDADKIIEKYGREYKITKIGSIVKEKTVKVARNGEEITVDRTIY